MTATELSAALEETLAAVAAEPRAAPVTTAEVADRLDLGRRSTYDRLERLVEGGYLETKKVGARGRVWWQSDRSGDVGPAAAGGPPAAASLIDVLDGADVGVFVLDRDVEVAWINEATERYFGLDRASVLGRDKRALVEDTVAPMVRDSATFAETVVATYEDNAAPERFECRVTAGEGREARWLEHRSEPIRSGRFAGGRVELYYDITAQKDAAAALSETEQRFRSLVQAVDEYAIFVLDADGRVRTWNEGAARIKGYDRAEILGDHVSTFYTAEDREAGVPDRNLERAAADGVLTEEGWRLRADGSRFWAHVTITALYDDGGALAGFAKVTRDMTDRREAEQRLRQERDFTRRVLETAPVGVVVVERDGTFETVNTRGRELLAVEGDRPQRVGAREVYDADGEFLPPDQRPYVRVFESGESVRDRLLAVAGPGGDRRWLSTNVEPLRDEDGGVERALVTIEDVTQLKEQAERLEHQRDEFESELEDVFERVSDGFYGLDGDLRLTYVNDRAEALLDIEEAAVLGEPLREAIPLTDRFEAALLRARDTGEPAFLEDYYEPLSAWFENAIYPSASGVSVYFREVTERKEREQDLEEYERIVETVDDGVYVLDADGRFRRVNDAFVRMTRYDRAALLGTHASLVFGDSFEDRDAAVRDRLAAGDVDVATFEDEVHTGTDETITVESHVSLFEVEDGTGRVGAVRDVTRHREFRETLTALYDSARELLDAETAAEVGDAVVHTATEVLDIAGVAVYRYDEAADELVPTARSLESGFMHRDLPETEPGASTVTAQVFASGESRALEDVTAASPLSAADTEMRAGVFVPMGEHGVLIVGSREVGAFEERTRGLLDLLAANAEAAYDRVEREGELAAQRERLDALDSLNAVFREITDAVIDQSTRAEIEATVCERLAGSEAYSFAWFGEVDLEAQEVALRTEAGVEDYLEGVTVSVDPADERSRGPTGRAVIEREMQVTRDVATDDRHDPWRDHVQAHDFRSSAAIPVVHEGTLFGVLNLYSDREHGFAADEQAVIGHLGEVVGHAIAAAERKRALLSDEQVELEFQIHDVFEAIGVDEPEGVISLDQAVPVGEGGYLEYGTATDDAMEAVRALVDAPDVPHWTGVSVLGAEADRTRFELELADPPVLSTVAAHGGHVREARFEDGDYYLRIRLAPTVEVRDVVESIREVYPAIELVSQRQLTRDQPSAATIEAALFEDLTERQRAALETAYHAGYFAWPRRTDGEQLADSLGVSPPTFHQHLRKAQNRLLTALLEERRADAAR